MSENKFEKRSAAVAIPSDNGARFDSFLRGTAGGGHMGKIQGKHVEQAAQLREAAPKRPSHIPWEKPGNSPVGSVMDVEGKLI